MGYSTTREPQNTQARWLTEPAVLALPQAISAAGAPPSPLRTTCFSRSGKECQSCGAPSLSQLDEVAHFAAVHAEQRPFIHDFRAEAAIEAEGVFVPAQARSTRSGRRRVPCRSWRRLPATRGRCRVCEIPGGRKCRRGKCRAARRRWKTCGNKPRSRPASHPRAPATRRPPDVHQRAPRATNRR